jgi:hypothetical protein
VRSRIGLLLRTVDLEPLAPGTFVDDTASFGPQPISNGIHWIYRLYGTTGKLVKEFRSTIGESDCLEQAKDLSPGPGTGAGHSAHSEAAQALRCFGTVFDPGYVGVRWPPVAPVDEVLNGGGLTFGDHLHATIGEVAGPARNAQRPGPVSTTAPEPDALNPAAYPEVSAHHRAKLARRLSGPPALRPAGSQARRLRWV